MREQSGSTLFLTIDARLVCIFCNIPLLNYNHSSFLLFFFSLQVAELSSSKTTSDSWIVNGAARQRQGSGVQGTCSSPSEIALAEEQLAAAGTWTTIVPVTPLLPGHPSTSRQFFSVAPSARNRRATHLRLNYYPDGGVARLRVHGLVLPPFHSDLLAPSSGSSSTIELSSVKLGGRGLACSNAHYGVPTNLLREGRGVDMGDGWETARHAERPAVIETDEATGLVKSTACDWCVLRLACVAKGVDRLVIETTHFKGNFPESARVDFCREPEGRLELEKGGVEEIEWKPLLKRTRLGPDGAFSFAAAALEIGPADEATHLRVYMYPDGGISRVRLFGRAVRPILDEEDEASKL